MYKYFLSNKAIPENMSAVLISISEMSYNELNCTWNNSLSHLRVPVLFSPVYQLRHRFASPLRSTSQYIQWNMVDCGNSRCSQERRAFRKELLSWSKKIPLAVGEFFSDYEILKKGWDESCYLWFTVKISWLHCQNSDSLAVPCCEHTPCK